MQDNKKKKQEIASVLLSLFVFAIILLSVAIYALPKYVFVSVLEKLDLDDSKKLVIIKKDKDLKPPDFSVFKTDEFHKLEKGYWYTSNDTDYTIGNNAPFNRIEIDDWQGPKGVIDINEQ